MRFSWTALILAPLPVPLIFSAGLSLLLGGQPLLMFFLLLVPACIISYGTTLFLFLPALYVLSSFRPLTGLKVCLLGLALGAVVVVPTTLMAWKESGPDSGPPVENFFTFFARWAVDPLNALYPLAGLITAGLYWWLATRRAPVSPRATD